MRFLAIICRMLICGIVLVTLVSPIQAQNDEISIGVIYPLSGAQGETGQSLKDAVELAVEVVNGNFNLDLPLAATKGLPNHGGARLKVVFADHQGDPETARKETERLISQGVVALVGCYQSAVTAKASEIAEREKVPFISGTSTSAELTQRGFQWFFRTTPDDGLFAENFFQFLNDLKKRDKKNFDRIAIFNENTIWGCGVADAELGFAQKYNYNVVMTVQYPQNAKNLENEVNLLKGVDPNIVFQASYLSDAVLSIQSYRKMGFKPRAIIGMNAGFISPEFIGQLGNDAENLFSREVWSYDLRLAKPIIGVIADLYQNRTNKRLNGNSAREFTAIMVLADAINRVAELTKKRIREALTATDITEDKLIMPWKGIKFDPQTNQNILGQGIIVQIQQQQYHTVWPFELARREIVWAQ